LCDFRNRFGRNAKIIHFIGAVKPWHHQYVPGVGAVVLAPGSYSSTSAAYDFIKLWWQAYNRTREVSCIPLHNETFEKQILAKINREFL
jgi:lipopolysaccharide biosynthesis glycosyltransferase